MSPRLDPTAETARSSLPTPCLPLGSSAHTLRLRTASGVADLLCPWGHVREFRAIQDQKLRDRKYAEDRTREAAEDTAQIEGQVEVLQSVLSATLRVDDYLDLEALKTPPPYPMFDPLKVGAPPSPPSEGDFAVAGPSALGRVFAASKHAARAEQRQAEYQQALDHHRIAAQQHAHQVEEARRRHEADAPTRRRSTDSTSRRSAR